MLKSDEIDWESRARAAEEELERVRGIWLRWRENGVANSIKTAITGMAAIGKIVEPDYPTDRLREDAFGRAGSQGEERT